MTIVVGDFPPRPAECSFCGTADAPDRTLVAGPLAYICHECVDLGLSIEAAHPGNVDEEAFLQCSFCLRDTATMLGGPNVLICGSCLHTAKTAMGRSG
jgi:hypothetical protein